MRRTRILPITLGLAMATAGLSAQPPARAATTSPDPTPLETAHAALARRAATQGMVLLENHNQVLPLPKKGAVALFGVGTLYTVPGGTGSGAVNNRHTVSVKEGFERAGYRVTTPNSYLDGVKANYEAKHPPTTGSVLRPPADYASFEHALTAADLKSARATDTAIYTIARDSGESLDRSSGKGDYLLTDTELANLKLVAANYRKVVVVLNVGGIVDTSAYKQLNEQLSDPRGGLAIDAVLLMSQAGQEGGSALVDVLNGTVTPSGKLSDTWASAYKYYPAAGTIAKNDGNSLVENYTEGVYVGYRYFDSFYRKINKAAPASVVNYPFGFGLSYTTFQVKPQSVKADASKVTVTARVTNTGKYAGKQVVQVYFSAPTGTVDKPYQQLAGYAKTDVLKPGQAQDVTITFRTVDMASYDEGRSAWVLDKGDYAIRVGDSSRNTHIAAKVRIPRRTVTERLSSQLVDDESLASELVASPSYFYRYRAEAKEMRAAKVVRVDLSRFKAPNNASKYDQDVAVAESSPQYKLDRSPISSVTAYIPAGQTDWGGTGKPYETGDGEKIQTVKAVPGATLFDVKSGNVTMEQFVAGLSVQQLADIVEGSNKAGSTKTARGAAGYTTPLYEAQGIPGMTLADGPAGLRITPQYELDGTKYYQYTTAFPVGTLLAQSFDRQLVAAVGAAVGQEMLDQGATLWLAPGMNIHRDPLNGRNFEYYSEDPLLTGTIASAITLGVQGTPGVGVTVKHYIANNQETDRFWTNAVLSERAAREVYLKGFEIAVKSAQPMALMNSYNFVNGTYAAANYDLNVDILRGEWGFKGLVMTDWGAGPRAGAAGTIYGGTDLIEPGNYAPDIINNVKLTPPVIDVSGLPFYNEAYSVMYKEFRYTWNTGSMVLAADGTDQVSTRVDGSTDLTKPLSMVTILDAIQNPTYKQHPAFASVDGAYREVLKFLAPEKVGLTAAQKAAISVTDVVHQTPGDESSPVVAYTVTVRGNYPKTGSPLRLGDVQRAAMSVLNVTMQSAPFAELAKIQGVGGVTVAPYRDQFSGDLVSYLSSSNGAVKRGARR